VVGVVNVPIIYYSVQWWTTLHQGPTLLKFSRPSITLDMLIPLLVMIAGFGLLFVWLLLNRLQGEIVERERDARWLQQLSAEAGR
jgi:heme exporter protein C